MKIFYDCEFLEGTQKKLFRKTVPTIDLISIGLVDEENRELYLISKEFNLKEAWNRWELRTGEGDYNNINHRLYWIRNNVLRPIFDYFIECENAENYRKSQLKIASTSINYKFTYKNFKSLLAKHGLTRSEIKFKILAFALDPGGLFYQDWIGGLDEYLRLIKVDTNTKVDLYGYYSAYDHVCLSWIFGKMIDLPDQFPLYTKDLKQMFDFEFESTPGDIVKAVKDGSVCNDIGGTYPISLNSHDALEDARWNKKLYEFLTNTL